VLFNSLDFLLFLPLVVGLYFGLPVRFRWLLLLVAPTSLRLVKSNTCCSSSPLRWSTTCAGWRWAGVPHDAPAVPS